jgi:hypothetical protein
MSDVTPPPNRILPWERANYHFMTSGFSHGAAEVSVLLVYDTAYLDMKHTC